MKLLKKAQITMETIFIYGIISVVVLSGIAALIYFGVLDLGNYLPDKCTVDSGDMTCTEWFMVDGSFIQIGLHNDLNKEIKINGVLLRSEDGSSIFTQGGSATSSCFCNSSVAGGMPIPPKSTGAFNLSAAATDCASDCVPLAALKGTKLKAIMSIQYKPAGGSIWQRTGGELIARVQ